jgi:tripartite-type tricarboxylate transporter receptor subunit TctC
MRLVVPFAAGSVAEAIFRPLAPGIEARLGQRFVIENRPGADGVIATEHVMKSAPDGYTLLIGSTSVFVVKQHMIKDLGFDPLTAFEPVSLLAEAPLIAVVGPDTQARTLAEMAEALRANRGKFNYGAQGAGSPTHLTGAFFSQQTGNSMVFIPYKGTPQLVTGLLSGDIHIAFPTLTAVAPQLRAGKLRVLAAMARQRMPELPDVPTAAEAGFPQLAATNWWMVAAPAGTPGPVTQRLGAEIRTALKDSESRKRLAAIGQWPLELSPEQTQAFLKSESARYKQIVEKGGVTRE